MSSWRQQALIEAPVEMVWNLVGDPRRHPSWWPRVLEVEGIPVITHDATYRQVTRTPRARVETTMGVEELEELKTIKVRCHDTGTFGRFVLADVRGSTFVDFELGMEPLSTRSRLFDAVLGKRYFREWAQEALDGLRAAAQRHPSPTSAPRA